MIPGVPTSISEAETRLLQRWGRGQRVVEAGALLGYSTIALAQVAAHVVSIDRHEGYSGPTERRFRSNLARAGVEGKVTVEVADALQVAKHDGDLAFLDLTCAFDLTTEVMNRTRTPFVALHDYGRQGCTELTKVIAHFERKQWRVVERADTLLVLKRPR